MTNRKLNWYESKDFTPEQTIERIWDVEDCKALLSRFMFYYNNDMNREILNELWVQEPDSRAAACFGSNWGFYESYDEIERYFLKERPSQRNEQLAAYDDPKAGPGHGLSILRMVDTPVIYIAEDGKTAQCQCFQSGEETIGKPDNEADGYWLFGRVAADFLKEANGWRIWHYIDIIDIKAPVGIPMSRYPVYPQPEDEFFRHFFEKGNPTVKFLAHDFRFHAADGWPQYPSAHKTYGPDNSYARECHPEYRTDGIDVEWETVKCAREAWGR